jgi:ribosomal protein S18 acetylase RimI-like enzyme
MKSLSIAIRAAASSDLESLNQLELECMGGTALPTSQMKWLLEGQGEDPAFFIRVAHEVEKPNELLGFICWKRRPDPLTPSYEILDLSVGKFYREERVEHALLTHSIESATAEGMIGMAVNVPRSNLAAAAFYLSHAFNVGHVVERYYDDGSAMEVFLKRLR